MQKTFIESTDCPVSLSGKPELDSLVDQVSHDLQTQLNSYRDPRIGLRMLSEKMGIHERTLGRLLRGENKPGYQTLYKIYRCLLNEKDDALLLKKVPRLVRLALENNNPQTIEEDKSYTQHTLVELQRNSIAQELYFLCACHPITSEEIKERYGSNGLEIAIKMEKSCILEEIKLNTFAIGKNATNFAPESLANIGTHLVQSFFRPEMTDEMGENYIALFAEGLNAVAYEEWLAIDEEAFAKKLQLSKNPEARGDIRALTFMFTEKMQTVSRKRI